jgi:hypothetical protein
VVIISKNTLDYQPFLFYMLLYKSYKVEASGTGWFFRAKKWSKPNPIYTNFLTKNMIGL